MAQIILITAASQNRDEPKRASQLGHRPAQWCHDNMKLEPDPIRLGTGIKLRSNQNVFVKVDQEEASPLQPGLYPSDRTPTEVRELLSGL